MSAPGLVSRVSPVHTAVRNCTGDEGGPFGFGDQVVDPKPPQAALAKSHGGERRGNAGTMIQAGKVERDERERTLETLSSGHQDRFANGSHYLNGTARMLSPGEFPSLKSRSL